MAKEWEKQIDKVCEKIVCKTKEYTFFEKLGTKLHRKIMGKKFCGKLCGKMVWKS